VSHILTSFPLVRPESLPGISKIRECPILQDNQDLGADAQLRDRSFDLCDPVHTDHLSQKTHRNSMPMAYSSEPLDAYNLSRTGNAYRRSPPVNSGEKHLIMNGGSCRRPPSKVNESTTSTYVTRQTLAKDGLVALGSPSQRCGENLGIPGKLSKFHLVGRQRTGHRPITRTSTLCFLGPHGNADDSSRWRRHPQEVDLLPAIKIARLRAPCS
jgi:hypothetical protein